MQEKFVALFEAGQLRPEEYPEAIAAFEEAIFGINEIIQDPETDSFMAALYRKDRQYYQHLISKLRHANPS